MKRIGLYCSILSACILITLAELPCSGQSQVGIPPWGTFDSDSFSSVNLANLNIHMEIPIRSLPGRGFPVNVQLISDTNTLGPPEYLDGGVGPLGWSGPGANYGTNPIMGNFVALGTQPGLLVFDSNQVLQCLTGTWPDQVDYGPYTVYNNFQYLDNRGTMHSFDSALQVATLTSEGVECPNFTPDPGWGTNLPAGASSDNSPYELYLTSGNGAPSAYVIDLTNGVTDDWTDAYGNSNFWTGTNGTPPDSLEDSAGAVAVTITRTSSSTTFSYTGPDGMAKNVVVTLSPYTVTGAVNCPNIPNPSSGTKNLVSSIALPDGTSYTFTYDPVLGRPQVITLPTGGQITYNYNGPNSGISCEDGGTSGFTKTTPDGMWTYARSYNSTTELWTTTVTDPLGDQTVYTFGSGSSSYCCQIATYEIQRKIYQDVGGTQMLLKTVMTCYNGNFTNCATSPQPSKASNGVLVAPYQKDLYTYLSGLSGPSLSEVTYMDSIRISEDKEYDFGASIPPSSNFVSDRQINYLGGSYSCPRSDITTDSAGNVTSKTTYVCNSSGHPTTVNKWIQGSTYATTQYAYY